MRKTWISYSTISSWHGIVTRLSTRDPSASLIRGSHDSVFSYDASYTSQYAQWFGLSSAAGARARYWVGCGGHVEATTESMVAQVQQRPALS